MRWKFVRHKGITSEDDPGLEIYFGMPREQLRRKLNFNTEKNVGRFPTEDSYGNTLGGLGGNGNWFRLGFSNNKNELDSIELLAGVIDVEGVPVVAYGGDLKQTIKKLKGKGFVFTKGSYSYSDFNNLIDIGSSKDNGGADNQVCWVFMATKTHLNKKSFE